MKRVLIAACGRCVWDDIAAFEGLYGPGSCPVIAVNFIGTVWPPRPLEHWVSLHHDAWLWAYYLQARLNGMNDHAVETIARRPGPSIKRVVPIESDHLQGTSSLYAAAVAVGPLGYDEAILCGAPMDDGGHFYDPPSYRTVYGSEGRHFEDAWRAAHKTLFRGRVRSMSGRTREWLGGPNG